jgi:hypothetical protein
MNKIHEPERKVNRTFLSDIQTSMLREFVKNNSWIQRPVIPLGGRMDPGEICCAGFVSGRSPLWREWVMEILPFEIVLLEIAAPGDRSSQSRWSGRSFVQALLGEIVFQRDLLAEIVRRADRSAPNGWSRRRFVERSLAKEIAVGGESFSAAPSHGDSSPADRSSREGWSGDCSSRDS